MAQPNATKPQTRSQTASKTPASAVSVDAEVEVVTPEQAMEWLTDNKFQNRKLRTSVVNRYAAEMRQGQWKLTPEPIVFDPEGNVFQGQHRLHAVIASGMPVTFLVIRGWDSAVFDVLDSGVKRTVADALQMEGIGWQASVVAAAAKLLAAIDGSDADGGVHTRAKSMTRSDIIAYANGHHEELEWSATLANRLYRARAIPAASNTALSVAAALISRVNDIEVIEEFFQDIVDGRLQPGDPRWLLIRWAPQAKQSGMAQNIRSVAGIVKCWNAWAEGKAIRSLAWRSQSERFPEPLAAGVVKP